MPEIVRRPGEPIGVGALIGFLVGWVVGAQTGK